MPRRGLTGERLIALFLFGVLVFTAPLMTVFNTRSLFLGVPILYFYLFLVWALLIGLLALIVEAAAPDEDFSGVEPRAETEDEAAGGPKG